MFHGPILRYAGMTPEVCRDVVSEETGVQYEFPEEIV